MRPALYVGYFTGIAGQSMGLYYIGNGMLVGIDVGGMKYDGTFKENPDGSLEGIVEYVIPPGMTTISGNTAGAQPLRVPAQLNFPANFANGQVIQIRTPVGAVNAKFEKIKDLP